MSRILPLLLLPFALFLAAPTVSAQLLQVKFTLEKDLKKYGKYMTDINGQPRLICESRDGLIVPGYKGEPVAQGTRVEVWIGDPKDPSVVPYTIKKGEIVPTNKKWLLSFSWDDNETITFFDRNQTFSGLAKEYAIRQASIAELKKARDSQSKGSTDWFEQHLRLTGANKRLSTWLRNTGYAATANKLDKEIKKQEKVITKEAVEYRLKSAHDSITFVDTPEDLIDASEEITNGIAKFKVQESQHVRIVYVDELEDAQIHGLLELAESAIDGFRQQFVDPYLDVVDFRDTIPDRIIQEFFFGPTDDMNSYENFLVQYYGQGWGKNKQRSLETKTNLYRIGRPSHELAYSMLQEQDDLEGKVAHVIGHTLVLYHYRGGTDSAQMAWLEEAIGYYVSFEFLGRNSLTCFSWVDEDAQRYRKPEKDELKEGEKTLGLGLRDAFNAMALAEGPKIDKLSMKTLFELENADLAKSWSFFDYLARKMGKKGQQWLRAGCKASVKEKSMINDWREDSNELYEIEGIDIFKKLDDEWRAFAESEQDTSAD